MLANLFVLAGLILDGEGEALGIIFSIDVLRVEQAARWPNVPVWYKRNVR